jgi:hypothetical protein
MRDVAQIKTLIESLNSAECPACHQRKKPRMTLCGGCYRALPKGTQARLYQRIGEGYEAAVAEALKFLHRMPALAPAPADLADVDETAGVRRADAPGQLFMFDATPSALFSPSTAGSKR